MSEPYFSIAIPTKNRPEQLADSIRSVLEQSFGDVEIVVCDNSDEVETARTAEVVDGFADPRVRYVRADGTLSMPDNWERAVGEARGEFVGVLTDRSVFRHKALETIHGEIESTGAKAVSWFNDLYGRDEHGTTFKQRGCTLRRHRLESRAVLDYFVNGHPKFASKIIPKLMTAVCHRSVLDAMRASAVGRCCPPVAPDFGSGFLMLAHCDWVLTLDETMYVSCGLGTGSAFRRRTELGDRFRRDLGMTWEDMVDRMPTAAAFSHALILNDFMRIRDALPERLGSIELNRPQYYVGCLNDYVKVAVRGVTERDEDVDLLLAGLADEPQDVRSQVHATRIYRRAVQLRQHRRDDVKTKVIGKVRSLGGAETPEFTSVFDALAWDAAHPRTPIAESFLDTLPTIAAEMKKVRKPAARRAAQPSGGLLGTGLSTASVRSVLRRLTRRA
jgi:hypothetical protein